MLALITALCLAQQPGGDALEYLRAHRDADRALQAGRWEDARTGFERCLALAPDNCTVAYALACTEARAAQPAQALDWLERALGWGYADAGVALWDEDLASLRGATRFMELIDRMGGSGSNRSTRSTLVRIWDGRECDLTLDVAPHPLGRCVAAAQYSGIVQLLDSRTGHTVRASPAFGSPVWAVDFDAAGEVLAALTWDGRLHLWAINRSEPGVNVEALAAPQIWDRLDSPAGALLRFDPSGQRLLVAADGRGAGLWSASGEKIKSWDLGAGPFVEPAWSPDGARIAIARGDRVRFFDGQSGERLAAALNTPAAVRSLAYSASGTRLATGQADGTLRVWDLESLLPVFERRFDDEFERHACVNPVAFSPDGNWIAGGTSELGGVQVLDASSGQCVAQERGVVVQGPLEPRELSWRADSNGLWFASLFGSRAVVELSVSGGPTQSPEYYGRAPRSGRSGLVAASCLRSVLALDPATGACRWNRTNLGRPGELLKTANGYFTTDLDDLDDLWLDSAPYDAAANWSGEGSDPWPLADCVLQLFDPKRVRAARAGVELVGAEL